MKTKHISSLIASSLLASSAALMMPQTVSAHGSMEVPVSRGLSCFNEGPETLKSAACQAAAATSGKQMLYDWPGVNQLPNGDHQAFVPNGQLCGGGKADYAGLNLARTDWATTPIAPDANGNFEFIFNGTAPHQTRDWQLFVTRDGWNQNAPLAWTDLEKFCTLGNLPTDANKRYHLTCKLPKKTGQHIIYLAWQRSDSTEAFYSCSDVNFTGGVSTFKELGQVRSAQDLATGTKVSFRLFDSKGFDVENIQVTLGFDNVTGLETNLAANWPFALAQKVNETSRNVSIGVLQTNNTIVPVKSAQDNRVYNRSNLELTYQIDIASPGNATPVPSPTVTAAPTATPVVTATPTPTPVVTATPKPTATPTVTPKPTATPVVTVAPTATPVATIAPTAAPTATPSGSCVNAWNSATAYTGGAIVSYQGRNYKAGWWTQGNEPSTNTGSGKPWTDIGACGAAVATPTATPKPTATATPVATAAPTATPAVTVAPTATPVTTVAPSNACVAAWNASTPYAVTNTKVSYNGRNYSNKWWTTGEIPSTSGQWGVWNDLGVCN
ncbi:lytic polysaccharide monooxygenase [Deefgea rivuli]|uniref:lytic polysaccharide monooxygenase n=1 Tax=Deefgea rivuli TaxID=400948 RepID=UPI000688CB52|nr:lytic polysaccharide monooxygenase [Deefgea rivuli]